MVSKGRATRGSTSNQEAETEVGMRGNGLHYGLPAGGDGQGRASRLGIGFGNGSAGSGVYRLASVVWFLGLG